MMEKNALKFKQIIIIASITSLILNLGIGIHFFQFLSKTSKFAGALNSLFTKFKILVICLFLSGIYTLIISLLFFKFKEIALILAILALIFIAVLNYKINSSIACPKPVSENEQIRYREKLIKEGRKKSNKIFKDAVLFLPDDRTVSHDKNRIVQGIRKLISFKGQSSEHTRINDSVNIAHINELFGMNYSSPNFSEFKIISDSLECRFICYSPDYKHFIAILTYKDNISHCDLDWYNGLVLFCEKKNDKIFIFSYTHPVSQWNKYTTDAFFYEVISSHFFHMGYYTLDMEGFKEHLHPFKKGFWHSKYFFDIIRIGDENYFRYQTKREYNHETSKYEYVKRGVYIIE